MLDRKSISSLSRCLNVAAHAQSRTWRWWHCQVLFRWLGMLSLLAFENEPFSAPIGLRLIANYSDNGPALAVALAEKTVYVAGRTAVDILDLTNPALPKRLGRYVVNGRKLAAFDGHFIVTVGSSHAEIVDARDRQNPRRAALLPAPGLEAISEFVTSGTLAYEADPGFGLEILDVADPTNPRRLNNYPFRFGQASGIAAADGYVYLVEFNFLEEQAFESRLRIIDVRDATLPKTAGVYSKIGWPFPPFVKVAVSDSKACVVGKQSLRIIDINDPSQPRALGELALASTSVPLFVGSQILLPAGSDGLQIIDASDPVELKRTGTFAATGATDAVLSGNLVLLAASSGLLILELIERPLLRMERLGESVRISWEDDRFQIQVNADAAAKPSWQTMEGAASPLVQSLESTARFYRLILP
ncbi:MAG: hypothetical protein AB1813_28005 [Verrucomicrobiota bacterium]